MLSEVIKMIFLLIAFYGACYVFGEHMKGKTFEDVMAMTPAWLFLWGAAVIWILLGQTSFKEITELIFSAFLLFGISAIIWFVREKYKKK